jgi:hypothetical protein
MLMPRKTGSILAMLTLALLLGTGAAHARPSAETPKAAPTSSVLNVTWGWLTSLVHGNNPFSSLFAASGTKTTTTNLGGSPTTTSDGGGFIDPNGGPK